MASWLLTGGLLPLTQGSSQMVSAPARHCRGTTWLKVQWKHLKTPKINPCTSYSVKAHLHFVRISQFAVRMRFPNSEFDTHFKSCSDEFNCYKKPMRLDLWLWHELPDK